MPVASIPRRVNPTSAEAQTSSDGIGRPMLFQITAVDSLEPLWPYALAMHVNPSSLQEQFNKSKNVVMTRGGFVEFVWPDDLDTLSADSTTGAFIGPDSGLTADSANPAYKIGINRSKAVHEFKGRHGTIAWERHTDLLELFRCNGQIFNGSGAPVLRSHVMCMYDRGIYLGWFTTFEVAETGDMPFQFKVTWEFKVVRTVYRLPVTSEPLMVTQKSGIFGSAGGEIPSASVSSADVEASVRNLSNNDQPVDPGPNFVPKNTEESLFNPEKTALNTATHAAENSRPKEEQDVINLLKSKQSPTGIVP